MSKPLEKSGSTVNFQSRLGTPDVSLQHGSKIANLPIIKNIDKFEKTLNSLLSSIATYNPNISDAQELVQIDKELRDSLDDLVKHKESGLEIKLLEEKSKTLNDNCKQILLGLSECRSKLLSLQSSDSVRNETKQMESNSIAANEVLQYAMKLAKFTTAPPTSTGLPPADFIWPSERALRSGMLAIASLNAEKLIGAVSQKEDQPQAEQSGEEAKLSPKAARRGSFGGSYGEDNVGSDDIIEDLDLFDPDEL
jgi:mediator of RNA polymerase II transcription subunit 4